MALPRPLDSSVLVDAKCYRTTRSGFHTQTEHTDTHRQSVSTPPKPPPNTRRSGSGTDPHIDVHFESDSESMRCSETRPSENLDPRRSQAGACIHLHVLLPESIQTDVVVPKVQLGTDFSEKNEQPPRAAAPPCSSGSRAACGPATTHRPRYCFDRI